ncbi:MAG: MT-A70 family methyltransferase [Thermoguttaceae bacterium]
MSDPRELVMLTQAERLLAQAKTINEVKSICDMAAAARVYYRQIELARDSAIHAATIEVTAKRKMGQLLKTANLATGARGNQHTGKMNGSQDATGPTRPRLRELNVTKSLSSRSQAIAGLPAATFDRYVNERVESRQEPTTAGLLRLARQQVVNDTVLPESHSSNRFVRDLRKLIAEGRRFSTIYADPPWRYDNQGTRACTDNHYPTLSVEQIAAEPVVELAADNAHLHLWTTNAFLPAAFYVIEAWGFEYKSCFVWVKPQFGIGNYYRLAHEFLLLGVRGSLPFRDHSQRSWIELERRGHSCKPEEIRAIIEQVSPAPYLELYGRTLLKNTAWTVHGNQLRRATNGRTHEADAKRSSCR